MAVIRLYTGTGKTTPSIGTVSWKQQRKNALPQNPAPTRVCQSNSPCMAVTWITLAGAEW